MYIVLFEVKKIFKAYMYQLNGSPLQQKFSISQPTNGTKLDERASTFLYLIDLLLFWLLQNFH